MNVGGADPAATRSISKKDRRAERASHIFVDRGSSCSTKTLMRSLANVQDKSSVILRLKTIRDDSPRQWGRMSSHQMICHLSDAFRVALGEKPARFTPNLINQMVIRWIALRAPMKKWPKGVRTPPEVNQFGESCTRPKEFDQDLQQLLGLIERFTATQRSFQFQPHPIFGPLSEQEWFSWGYRHMDHHLRQFGA